MDNAASEGPFGVLLRRYRLEASLSQEALAERARLSWRTVSDLERGLSQTPQRHTLAQLADALGLTGRPRHAFETAARRPLPHTGATERSTAGGRAGPTVPLVGRAQEIAHIERHLRGQGPPVLLLAGEPGIGKSRLLYEAAQRATRQGWRVLAGGCQRRGGQEPYAPLLQALQRHVQTQAPTQLRVGLRGCAWLVRLLPELAAGPIEPLPAWALTPEQERRLTFEAVDRFLANVAGPAGTLLVLDDLQWAGPDALDLLATLARSAPEVPLRVIGAYRDTDVRPEDALAATLADLAQAELATHHALGILPPEDTARLLDAVLAGQEEAGHTPRERVLQRSGGVPFFVVSCARALAAGLSGEAAADNLPWDLAQSVRQRVAALPAVTREVLGAAAVVGREGPYALLTAAVAQPEGAVLAALEAARHAHLLEAGVDGYRFVHDVIREVVEADQGTARRAWLHRRIAEALEQGRAAPGGRGAPPVEALAYHYAHTAEHARAALWLERAGDQAAAGFATAAALEHYAAARAHLVARGADAAIASRLDEKLGDLRLRTSAYVQAQEHFARARQPDMEVTRRTDLWRKEGVAWEKLGEYPRALAAFEAAESEGGRDGTGIPAQVRAEIELGRSNVYLAQGPVDAVEAAAARALDLVSAESPTAATGRIRAWAAWHQAMAAWMRGDLAGMDECFGRMRAIAEGIGDQHSVGRAWHGQGMAAWLRGDLALAEERARSALAILELVGEQAAMGLCWGLLGIVALERGAPAQAGEHFQRGLALHEQTGHQSGLPYAWDGLGKVARLRGDLVQAEECYRRSLAVGERLGDEYIAASWRHLGGIICERGDLNAAVRWCRAARHTARHHGFRLLEAQASLAQAQALLRGTPTRSRLRTAAALLEHGRARATAHGLAEAVMEAALLTVELHLHRSALTEAQTATEQALELATSQQRRWEEGVARRLLGQCALARTEYQAAEAHLRAALALQEEMGAGLEAARTRMALAEALGARAAHGLIPAEARTLVADAQAQFAASGAALDLAQTRERLPGCGRAGRSR